MNIETAITKLITREAEAIEDVRLGDKFRLITLRGRDLCGRAWSPGDILQVTFRRLQHRAYTPIVWSVLDGATTFLAYIHGPGMASDWAATLEVGDHCHLFGPRSGTDLASLPRPALLVGDETSFSTAAAQNATASGARGVELLFEVTSIAESRAALEALHVEPARRIKNVLYWAAGKKGRSHF